MAILDLVIPGHQNETITSELDSAYQKTPKNTYLLPFRGIHLKSYFFKMADGGHLGFMQIK